MCGYAAKYNTPTGRRRSHNEKKWLNANLTKCRNDWKAKVEAQVRGTGFEVNAALAGAVHIVNKNKKGFLKETASSISCSQPNEASCEREAKKLLGGISPRRGPQKGCWSKVPRGCTVQTGGDWAIHFNRCSGNSGASSPYSAVCHKPVAFKYRLKNYRSNISCGQPPESLCSSAAAQVLAGHKPGRGMNRGCWSWVPRGCSVQTGGDWTVHFNRCSGTAPSDKDYSAVCAS